MSSNPYSKGILYVVATPIGNLEDITLRALKILKKVNLIICEDTRTTRKILNKYSISKKTRSYYSPKEAKQAVKYLDLIEKGTDVALISESGTPCISDPGYEIIKQAYERDIEVAPIPGPSALTAGISVSGIKADEVYFGGFIPRKKNARKKYLKRHINKNYTFVFFDSKYRIKDTLKFINEISPDGMIFIAREMTKKFEEYIRGKPEEVKKILSGRENLKGEFLIICSPSEK